MQARGAGDLFFEAGLSVFEKAQFCSSVLGKGVGEGMGCEKPALGAKRLDGEEVF